MANRLLQLGTTDVGRGLPPRPFPESQNGQAWENIRGPILKFPSLEEAADLAAVAHIRTSKGSEIYFLGGGLTSSPATHPAGGYPWGSAPPGWSYTLREYFLRRARLSIALNRFPWPGNQSMFVSGWLTALEAHGLEAMLQEDYTDEELEDRITMTLLASFDVVADRVEALTAKKVRNAQRRAFTNTIVITLLGAGLGAVAGGTALAIAKAGLKGVDRITKADTARSLASLSADFQSDHAPFAAQLIETAKRLDAAAAKTTAPPAPHLSSTPAGAASAPAGVPYPATSTGILDMIVNFIRALFGGLRHE